ncbi:MAG: glycosyltransferase family 2 protein [Gammaproteobacteria bacterium]|jgi:GT2 family glycosyltransferase
MKLQGEPCVYVIVLNYNGYGDTIECVRSVRQATYQNVRVVIVDNKSSDGSFERFQKYFSRDCDDAVCALSLGKTGEKLVEVNKKIVLIQAAANRGYGQGNNLGIKYALTQKADYIVILNNDTIVDQSFIEPLVESCEQDREIGVAGGKILFFEEPDTIWYAGGRLSPLTALVKHFHFRKKDVGLAIPDGTNFISGCMLFVPARTFSDVGLLNEEYFMYVEDVEFSFRILKRGLRFKVCEQSKVWHKVGASSGGRLSELSVYLTAKNRIKFIRENLSAVNQVVALTYSTVYMTVWWLSKGKFGLCKWHIKGSIEALLTPMPVA